MDTIDARCREGRAADAKSAREHSAQLQQLQDKIMDNFRNHLEHGSMSKWTQEEREKIEQARRDPLEAKQKMTKDMRECLRSYKQRQHEMQSRVRARSPMNIRKKEEREKIEAERQDPQEAKDRIVAHLASRKAAFIQQRKEMSARIQENQEKNPCSMRHKDEQARIEEMRQDPEEARAAMQEHLKELARSFAKEKMAMTDRVGCRPCECQWSPDKWAVIEMERRDPKEAMQKAKAHMKALAESYKEEREQLSARLKDRAPLNIRTKDDIAHLEEARRDPQEASEKAKADMEELCRSYQDRKREIHQRVHQNPLVTFRSPRAQENVARRILKNNPLK
jgi:hypothetical protein